MEKKSIYPAHRKIYVAWPDHPGKHNNLLQAGESLEKKGFIAYPKKSNEQASLHDDTCTPILSCKEGLFVAYPTKNASALIQSAIAREISKETKWDGYVAYPKKRDFTTLMKYKNIRAIFRKKVAVFSLCHLFRLKAS